MPEYSGIDIHRLQHDVVLPDSADIDCIPSACRTVLAASVILDHFKKADGVCAVSISRVRRAGRIEVIHPVIIILREPAELFRSVDLAVFCQIDRAAQYCIL